MVQCGSLIQNTPRFTAATTNDFASKDTIMGSSSLVHADMTKMTKRILERIKDLVLFVFCGHTIRVLGYR